MRSLLRFTTALAVVVGMTASARAAILYDQDVTPDIIFGDGNANGGFTVDRNNGVELGLRAKLRFDHSNSPQNIFNSNGDGTYSFEARVPPTGFTFNNPPPKENSAVWNFEWSINTDFDDSTGRKLDDLTYTLQIDFDPSAGTNFYSFDPINDINPAIGVVQWDHGIGNNSTPNGGGMSIPNNPTNPDPDGYAALIANNNVAQNSWNYGFFATVAPQTFYAAAQGIYDFVLTAYAPGVGQVAQTSIRVYSTPEPSSLALLSLGVAGLAGVRHRRRRRDATADNNTDAPTDA